MGLDIVAFEHATLVSSCDPNSAEHEDHIVAWTDEGMARSLRGLQPGRCYAGSGQQVAFRAGSYTTYNEWRRELAKRALGAPLSAVWANPSRFIGRPFFEILNFSDCEGTIGPIAAAELAADFASLRETVAAKPLPDPEDEDWFMNRYDAFRTSFRLAAHGGGLVLFG